MTSDFSSVRLCTSLILYFPLMSRQLEVSKIFKIMNRRQQQSWYLPVACARWANATLMAAQRRCSAIMCSPKTALTSSSLGACFRACTNCNEYSKNDNNNQLNITSYFLSCHYSQSVTCSFKINAKSLLKKMFHKNVENEIYEVLRMF